MKLSFKSFNKNKILNLINFNELPYNNDVLIYDADEYLEDYDYYIDSSSYSDFQSFKDDTIYY